MNYDEKTIATAMKYDMSPVMERYAEHTRLPPDVLREHEREIKRFLALSSLNPGKYGMRGPLDELWHTFILFTSSYAEFCRQVGGTFVHHLPADPKTRNKPQAEKTGYMLFLEDYEQSFREPAPVHLWPRVKRVGGDVNDPSCDQCGIYCAETCAAIELMPPAQRF
jgi:hypothetical protein